MRRGKRREPMFSQKGIALLMVTVGISIILSMAYEFDGSALVDFEAASKARDDMQMEFNVRSGMNLSQLLVRIQTQVLDKNRDALGGDPQIGDFTGFFLGFFGGDRQEVDDLAEAMGGFTEDTLKTLGVSNGRFDIQIGTEDGKINVNCAADIQKQENLKSMIEALFYLQAYDPIFQNPAADGWRRTREEQAAAIVDYIDRDTSRVGQSGAAEQYGYESLRDRYLPKNQRIDTVGELKQVRGVDDRLWTLFGSAFTVYGPRGCTLNIGSVSDPNLIAAIISLSAKNPEDPVVRDPQKLWALARRVSESSAPAGAGGFGAQWANVQDFANFVKDPQGSLTALFGQQSAQGLEPTGDVTDLGPAIAGVELDTQKLSQIVSAGARATYRVEVTAQVGNLTKRVVGVWDTQVVNQNQRNPALTQGAWVYWREEQ